MDPPVKVRPLNTITPKMTRFSFVTPSLSTFVGWVLGPSSLLPRRAFCPEQTTRSELRESRGTPSERNRTTLLRSGRTSQEYLSPPLSPLPHAPRRTPLPLPPLQGTSDHTRCPMTSKHSHTRTHTYSHSHTHTLSHLHTHTLTHTYTPSHILSRTHSHSHILALSLTPTHTFSLTPTHTHTHLTHTYTHILTYTHSLTHTHTYSHTYTHTYSHTLTRTVTHTYTLVHTLTHTHTHIYVSLQHNVHTYN